MMKNTADVQVQRDERILAAGERNRHERGERRAEADVRRELEQKLVGPIGHQVFFGEQLDAVGQRLQPAELAADARRAEPILNAAGDLALHPDEEQRADRDQIHEQKDMDQRSDDVANDAIRATRSHSAIKETQPVE